MPYISDSRKPRGVGILALQYNQDGSDGANPSKYSIDMRPSVLATRIYDRQDTGEGLGTYVSPNEMCGDVTCSVRWPNDTREIPGWSFAWASVTTGPELIARSGNTVARPPGFAHFTDPEAPPTTNAAGSRTIIGVVDPDAPPQGNKQGDTPKHGGRCAELPDAPMILPLRHAPMQQDDRFQKIAPTTPRDLDPRIWAKPFLGMYGITLASTNEERQIEYLMQTDPRIIAPNAAGDVQCGSLVCDLTRISRVDPSRTEHVQSMMWVVKQPVGCNPAIFPAGRNMIAWNIGLSGCLDVRGGSVIDFPEGTITLDPPTRTIGMVSRALAGPFDVGAQKDKHNIGIDADGDEINSLHIHTQAFYRKLGSAKLDAPLFFEGECTQPIEHGDKSFMVHLEYYEEVDCKGDPIFHDSVCGKRKGEWRWRAESKHYTDTTHTEDQLPPPPGGPYSPPPVITPNPRPTVTTPSGGSTSNPPPPAAPPVTFTPGGGLPAGVPPPAATGDSGNIPGTDVPFIDPAIYRY